jgi:hypothetical protein
MIRPAPGFLRRRENETPARRIAASRRVARMKAACSVAEIPDVFETD